MRRRGRAPGVLARSWVLGVLLSVLGALIAASWTAAPRSAVAAPVPHVQSQAPSPGSPDAQPIVDGPNGAVHATVTDSTTGVTYLGGQFTHWGPQTGGGAAVSATNGAVNRNLPKVDGDVLAVAADGSGGWYLGGDFQAVGGFPRVRLAHVLADGTVDPAWQFDPNGDVLALAVSGSTVYVGGAFTSVEPGQTRNHVAALGADGTVATWNPGVDGEVSALAVTGSSVFVGGEFGAVGGQPRSRLAAVGTDGVVGSWNPGASGQVFDLAVGGSVVYAGGAFTTVGGVARNYLAAVGLNGVVSGWNPGADSTVFALGLSGSTVYVGGMFTSVGGVVRRHLAAVGVDGVPTGWNPSVDGFVDALAVSGSTVFVGGGFGAVAGQERGNLAAVGMDGTLAAWNPGAAGWVQAMAVSGSTVFVGGGFSVVGGQRRGCLAAVGADGQLTNWNPSADSHVYALTQVGAVLYAGGSFTAIGGQSRNYLAAVGTDGVVTGWNPNADYVVEALAFSGTTIYAGGMFSTVGGLPRSRLAAIGANGAVLGWNPGASGNPYAMVVIGSTIYMGGTFTSVGGQARNRLAAVDTGGAVTGWNPGADDVVRALGAVGSTLYVGGDFRSVGGLSRSHLAAVGTDGAVKAWNPGATDPVFAVAVSGSMVYVGGAFTQVGGQERIGLAAVDVNGTVAAWSPQPNSSVVELSVVGPTVLVGGHFTRLNGALPGSSTAYFGRVPSATVPGAPTGLVGLSGDGQVSVAFTAPVDTGGSAVTNYQYSTDNGATWVARSPVSTASPVVIGGLVNGTAYQVRLRAVNAVGPGAVSAAVAVTPYGSALLPVVPVRVADTRVGSPVPVPVVKGPLAAGATLVVPIGGANGVPGSAGAASVNVTAVLPSADGFLTVYPCDAPRPNASNVNYVAGQVVPNAVLGGLGVDGTLCVFTSASTDVVVDLNGWFPRGTSFTPMAPVRIADTRVGQPVAFPVNKVPIPAGGVLAIPAAGQYGVPGNANAVSLNVTAVAPASGGFLTVFPCGAAQPNASSVNYVAGQVVPNAVVSGVGTGGQVCVFSSAQANVVVDLNGWYPAGPTFTPLAPVRVTDTRPGQPVAFPVNKVPVQAGAVLAVPIAGQYSVPANAGAVVVNVTAVSPAAAGYLTVFPCGAAQPQSSNVNYVAGQVVPNMVQTGLGTGGQICVFSSATTNLVIDLNGWYPAPG